MTTFKNSAVTPKTKHFFLITGNLVYIYDIESNSLIPNPLTNDVIKKLLHTKHINIDAIINECRLTEDFKPLLIYNNELAKTIHQVTHKTTTYDTTTINAIYDTLHYLINKKQYLSFNVLNNVSENIYIIGNNKRTLNVILINNRPPSLIILNQLFNTWRSDYKGYNMFIFPTFNSLNYIRINSESDLIRYYETLY